MKRTASAFVALATVLGCTHPPSLPVTPAQVAQQVDPAALVAYLGQPDATASVCAPDRLGAELRGDRRLGARLVAGLRAGGVPPERFARCALALLPGLPPERAAELLERILEAGVDLAGGPTLETDAALQGQLAALQRVALEREPGVEPPRGVGERVLLELRALSRSARTGPEGQRAAGELGALLEAERGTWRGRPVSAEVIDAAAREGGEPALLLLARRLPDPALRAEAERRVVRQASAVTVDPTFAWLGKDGILHLAERLSTARAAALARNGARIEVPVAVGGRALTTLVLPVSFLRPTDLVLEGERPGARGPDLRVEVERPSPDLVVYVVRAGERRWEAVVEWRDAAGFRVVTRGARGRPGNDGARGADGGRGRDGEDASCFGGSGREGGDGGTGGAGGAGGDGGNGGPGGDGGDVEVALAGVPAPLQAETAALVQATLASEGGRGGHAGRGGSGGDGGAGGSGGSGTSCSAMDGPSVSLSSGRSGSSGSKGSGGRDGAPGPSGRPGAVRLVGSAAGP